MKIRAVKSVPVMECIGSAPGPSSQHPGDFGECIEGPEPDGEQQVPELPPDVIAVLLQYVSPKDRLTSCAFVCKAWHAACCSSIDSMTLTCSKQALAHNAFKWLAKHGKNTISVHMTVAEAAEKLCLDCHLQEWSWVKDLRLTGFNLRQGSPSSSFAHHGPGVAATLARSEFMRCKSSSRLGTLTALTHLELDGCVVPDDLVSLSSLRDLQHLTVSVMTHDPTGFSGVPFQSMGKLTHLYIGVDVCDVSCQHLSCLTSLKEFHISKYAAISHLAFSDIGALQQLTCLRIQCASWPIDPYRIPGFAQMTGLKHLEVYDSKELNPGVLAAMTNLEHLAIVKTGLNPSGVGPADAVGIPTLLSILPDMQQLTCLHLVNCLNWPQPYQAYAALTASPVLARLILRCCHVPGVAEFAFAKGRVLPQLTQLVVHSDWPNGKTLEEGDVGRVVCSCPALQQLEADLSKQSVSQLQLLQQLGSLTSLSVSALADEGLSALAQLRQLRHLDIERAKGLTVPGISLLTALTGLVELRGPVIAYPFAASHHGRPVHLRSRAGPNGEAQPDVWSQLSRLLHDSCAEKSPRRSRSSGGGSLCFQLSDRGSAGESAEIQRLILATQHFWQ